MLFNRRNFLCGASAVTVSTPALMRALTTEAEAASANTAVVIFELNGGVDTFNMVIPWDTATYTPVYTAQRGNMLITQQDIMNANGGKTSVFDATPGGTGTPFAMHPSLAALPDQTANPAGSVNTTDHLYDLYQKGNVALLMGAGLPPNAESRDGHQQAQFYWQTAGVNNLDETTYGWAGLAIDQLTSTGSLPPEISFDGSFQIAMNGQKNQPLVIGGDMINFNPNYNPIGGNGNNGNPNFGSKNMPAGTVALTATGSYALNELPGEFARSLTSQTSGYVGAVQSLAKTFKLDGVTPSTLPKYNTAMRGRPNGYQGQGVKSQFLQVARSILGGAGSRVYYVRQGGYDTHSGQLGQQAQLFAEFSESVTEFYRYIKKANATQRVVIITMSDFGRRPYSNSGQGTDHGTSTMHWVIGDIGTGTGGTYFHGGVPGVRSTGYPDIQGGGGGLTNNLDNNGNVFVSVDFRYHLSAVIQYLGADPTKVLAASDSAFATVGNSGAMLAGGTSVNFNQVLGVH